MSQLVKTNSKLIRIEHKVGVQLLLLISGTFLWVSTTPAVDYCNSDLCSYGRHHIRCENNSGEWGSECLHGSSLEVMTTDLKMFILKKHNVARNNIALGKVPGYLPADRMPQMSWDIELEKNAEFNARRCKYGHDECRNTEKYRSVGQNIGILTGNYSFYFKDPSDVIDLYFDAWFDEYRDCNMSLIENYQLLENKDVKIGHFTQIVGMRANKIGCAMSQFLSGDNFEMNIYLKMPPKCYICNYYDPRRMSLFRIPNRNDEYSDRGRLWLTLLEEKSINTHKIRVCSDHFLKKKPAKASDYLDLDWGPNKNLGRFSKNWKRIEYHFNAKKKDMQVENLNDYQNQLVSHNSASNGIRKCDVGNQGIGNNDVGSNDVANSYFVDFENNGDVDEFENNNFVYGDVNQFGNKNFVYADVSNNGNVNDDLFNDNTIDNNNDSINNNSNDISNVISNQSIRIVCNKNTLLPAKKRKIQKIEEIFFLSRDMQTDLSSTDIEILFKYYQEVVEERDALLLKISTLVIDYEFFKENDRKTLFYTGLPTWSLLTNFSEMIEEFLPTHFNCKLSRFQMVALTLMKLRLNLSFTDIGYRFQISTSSASRYFHRCIYILHKLFYKSLLIHWPERKNLLLNTPSYFKSTFKELVTVIVDCFEIFTERSAVLKAAAQAFSNYKHHATLKFLIGISTGGMIIFISPAYGGRASDKEIVKKSNFLENLQDGDVVLADKGFLIENEVNAKNASLKIPSFARNGNQLHPTQIEESRNKSRIRIHVERLICVLREKFNICADVAEMSAIAKQNDLFDKDLYDKIIYICCCLVNICPPVVNNDFEM